MEKLGIGSSTDSWGELTSEAIQAACVRIQLLTVDLSPDLAISVRSHQLLGIPLYAIASSAKSTFSPMSSSPFSSSFPLGLSCISHGAIDRDRTGR